ncbi:MAG: PAS domain-containing protein [Sneathiellales bacterium]|nr:PAS domain-containing protein [Sneathiellales bacterium]
MLGRYGIEAALSHIDKPACLINKGGAIILTNVGWDGFFENKASENHIKSLFPETTTTDILSLFDDTASHVSVQYTDIKTVSSSTPAISLDVHKDCEIALVICDTAPPSQGDFLIEPNYAQVVLEAIPAPVFCKDINHIYTACNEEFLTVLGKTREEVIGKNVFEVAPSDKARVYREADDALFLSGGRQVYETTYRYADGTDHDVVFHKSVFSDQAGKPAGLIGIMLDFTERRAAERSLVENEALLQAIVDNSPAYIFVKDLDGRYIVAGNKFTEKIGWQSGYLLGKTDYEVFPKAIASQLRQNDKKVLDAGTPLSRKESFKLGSHEITNLTVKFPLKDASGEVKGLAGIAVDMSDLVAAENKLKNASRMLELEVQRQTRELSEEIRIRQETEKELKQSEALLKEVNDELEKRVKLRTAELEKEVADRKKIELALRDREKQFEASASSASDWFWATDENHCFTFFSDRLEEIAGVSPNVLLGLKRWETGATRMTEEEWAPHIEELNAHKSFRDFRFILHRKNGELRHISISGVPIFNDDGTFKGYRGAGTDITEQIETFQRAQIAEQQLQQAQKMEAIGQLTGGVAHDFNNILAIILGNIELLQDDIKPDNELYPLMNAIERSATRGANLTQRLLAYSRKQALRPQEIDLNALTKDMLDLIDRLLGETIHVQTDFSEEIDAVYADPGQVENSLMNLCINSSDAMPAGGDLLISTGSLIVNALNQDQFADLPFGNYSWLCVKDTGTGMDQETLTHVFEPFFTTKETGKGTGLGLSMIYGFAKQSDGTVRIESEVGKGTIVKMYLPTKPAGDT